jgi:hypothetical protein
MSDVVGLLGLDVNDEISMLNYKLWTINSQEGIPDPDNIP